VQRVDLNGHGRHYLAETFLDVTRYLLWWLVGGLVACGSWWYGGVEVYHNWVRESPAPPVRLVTELRLRREARRGFRALEKYLAQQQPLPTSKSSCPGADSARRGERSTRRSRTTWWVVASKV
jgi:hypothetical protein